MLSASLKGILSFSTHRSIMFWNPHNALKNTVGDRCKGVKTMKVLWENTVEDWYKGDRTLKVDACKIKNDE